MSNTSEHSPDGSTILFVDPWCHEADHQRDVPSDAIFLGAWERDIGIDELSEALFLVRDGQRDFLWSLTTNSVQSTKESLVRRASGDPDWISSKTTCGWVVGGPYPAERVRSRCAPLADARALESLPRVSKATLCAGPSRDGCIDEYS